MKDIVLTKLIKETIADELKVVHEQLQDIRDDIQNIPNVLREKFDDEIKSQVKDIKSLFEDKIAFSNATRNGAMPRPPRVAAWSNSFHESVDDWRYEFPLVR